MNSYYNLNGSGLRRLSKIKGLLKCTIRISSKFLILTTFLTILYLGLQINKSAYDKEHVVALMVILIFIIIGSIVEFFLNPIPEEVQKLIPPPMSTVIFILKALFIYLPTLALLILVILTGTGTF